MSTSTPVRHLAFRAESVDEIRRVVRAVVATAAEVDVYDVHNGIIAERLLIGGVQTTGREPVLIDHDRSVASIVGTATDFTPDGDVLLATLEFASGTTAANECWALVVQGHARSVSVGYTVLQSQEIPAGQSATIGGKTYSAPSDRPVRIVTQWRIREISLIPVPADAACVIGTRSTPSSSQRNPTIMNSLLDTIGSDIHQMHWPKFFAAGMTKRGQSVPREQVDVVRAALSSPGGLDDVRGLVGSKVLTGFRSEPDTTAGWLRTIDLPNFLPAQIAAVNVSPRLERVPRGEQAGSVGFGISTEGWRLARYAVTFALDEQDLLDNGETLDTFAIALEEIGRAARRLIPDLVYSTLLANGPMADDTPVFDAARSNLATAAMGTASLDAGMAAMVNQLAADESADPVHRGLAARYLTVPAELLGTAKRLARLLQTGHNDLFVRPESRMGTAGVLNPATGEIVSGSATNWLLSVPSDQAAGVVIGALSGSVEPTIRAYTLSAGEFGFGFDVTLDLACTVVDPQALYWSDGTV